MAKKKQQSRSLRNVIIAIILLVACVGILGAPVWQNIYLTNLSYILKVNGASVSRTEYRFNLAQAASFYEMYYGSESWDVSIGDQTLGQSVINNAADNIVYTKLCLEHAKQLKLTLDDDDRAKAADSLAQLKTYYDDATIKYIGASDSTLRGFIESNILANKVYEYYTKDYVINDADFDAYFDDYYNTNIQSLVKVTADYIVTDTIEKAAEVIERMKSGEDLNSLVAEYSLDAEDRPEPESVEVTTSQFPAAVVDAAYSMRQDEITQEPIAVLPAEDDEETLAAYYVLSITGVIPPDMDELRNTQTDTYINDQKQAIFKETYSVWDAEKIIKVNSVGISAIPIKGVTYKDDEISVETEEPETEPTLEPAGE
jgi:foldase protein PrsA